MDGSPVALVVREAGDREAEELARDDPVEAVPGCARSSVAEAPAGT